MAAPSNFVLSERALDHRSILLTLAGDTKVASGRVRRRLQALVKGGREQAIVDLSAVSFVDPSVVQALAEVAAEAQRSDVRLMVVEPIDPLVARPLQLGNLDRVAEVVPTMAEAVERAGVPPEALAPAAPPPREPVTKPRRRQLGRRGGYDQDVVRELGQLRRTIQELQQAQTPGQPEPAVAQPADTSTAEELAEARAEADRMEIEAEQAHARIQQLERELGSLREAADTLRAQLQRAKSQAAAERQRQQREEEERQTEESERRRHAEAGRLAAEQARRRLEQEAEGKARARDDKERRRAEEERRAQERAEAEARERERERAETESRERARADEERRAQERAEVEARERAEVAARDRAEAERAARMAAAEAEEAARVAAAEAGPRPRVPVWSNPSPIDLNSAEVDDLVQLPGIGRRPAERIIAFREERGGLKSVDELFEIAEIPRERLTRIRSYLRV